MTFDLGPRRDLDLPQGTVTYRDVGSGPTVVFVHGLLVNGDLWADVAARLLPQARVVLPDLPLGSHRRPMPAGSDLSPPALADLLAGLLEALDLREVTLVGNDTGGALCQLVLARHPERLAGLVLTSCDSYRHFPPTLLRPLVALARHRPALTGHLLGGLVATRVGRRAVLALVQHQRASEETLASYFDPLRHPDVRRDAVAVAAGLHRRHTLGAARSFPGFRRPVLLAWGADGTLLFPRSDAEKLTRAFPYAHLVDMADSRAFVPADQPEQLAELLRTFVSERVGASAPAQRS